MSDPDSSSQSIFADIHSTLEEAFVRLETQARARADETMREAEQNAAAIRQRAEEDTRRRLADFEREMVTLRQDVARAEATLARLRAALGPSRLVSASDPVGDAYELPSPATTPEPAGTGAAPTPFALWGRRAAPSEPTTGAAPEAGEPEAPEETLRALREALDALRAPADDTSASEGESGGAPANKGS